MTVSQAKGAKGTADRYWSRLVRARSAMCERCHEAPAIHAAHIIPRGYAATRCEPDNGVALCGECHRLVDSFPDTKMDLVRRTIGVQRYDELRSQAQAGLGVRNAKVFWRDEVARLKAMAS